ncbi:MAG: hypothetical protein ACKPKW_13770 [Dolichospermum sp.]
MGYTTGGQDAHPTRVLLLKFVPHSNGICCNLCNDNYKILN